MKTSSAPFRFLRLAPSAFLGLLWCAAATAQTSTSFPVDSPTGLGVGPDGAMRFTNYFSHTIGRVDANGNVTESPTPGSSAVSVVTGPDGNLWYTASAGRIGRMTASGAVTEFALPNPASQPHDIIAGPDGSLWFGEDGANRIGRITTSGLITEFPVPGRVLGLTAGPDGNVWFTAGTKIGRITPTGAVTEFGLPSASSFPIDIVAGPDGNLWFTESDIDFGLDTVGWITTNGVVTELQTYWINAVCGIVAGADGNLWVGGYGALGRITTAGAVTQFSAPIGIAVMAAAPDGAIWFTDYDSQKIYRFAPVAAPCVANTTSLCLAEGRFRVTANWRAGDGSTGHGRGVGLTANSGYFWFFDAGNVEMVVKVLDGCASNQHEWVFAAGLTNVEVTTTVTDTFSGLSKTYLNQQGAPFAPVQDTAAFEACP